MRKFTESELWAFVGRADSHERVEIAIRFLSRLDYLSNELFDDLMDSLAYTSRELYHEEREYSASCLWNAPGMSVRDFVR